MRKKPASPLTALDTAQDFFVPDFATEGSLYRKPKSAKRKHRNPFVKRKVKVSLF